MVLTIKIQLVHSSDIRLCLASNEANTIRLSTVTDLCIMSISIDVVVESKLFVRQYISLGKDAHSDLLADDPFRDIAVRCTGVVEETTFSASLRSINELEHIWISTCHTVND